MADMLALCEDDCLLKTCIKVSHETSKTKSNTFTECCKKIYGMGSTVCASLSETKQCTRYMYEESYNCGWSFADVENILF
jgi:hypothetical protein